MKKIIALVLTVLMLVSCLSLSAFAARFSEIGEPVTTDVTTKVLDTAQSGGTYLYAGDLPLGNGSTVTFDILFTQDGAGTYSDAWGQNWFCLSPSAIGVGGATIAYTFELNQFYNVSFVADNDSTEIFVDGASIGTVAKVLSSFGMGVEFVYFDNIVVEGSNGNTYSQDFEGYSVGTDPCGRWYFSGEGTAVVSEVLLSSETTYDVTNVNRYDVVTPAVTDGKALYFANNNEACPWPDGSTADGSAYLYTQDGIIPSDKVGACVLSFDICPLNEEAELRNYFGWLVYNQANGKFDTLDIDWEVGTWHHIDVYCFYGSVGSVLYVDGQLAPGTAIITQVPGSQWCGGAINVGLDNIEVYESGGANGVKGELIYSEDFEDGVWQKKNSDGGGRILDKVIVPAVTTTYEHDLGFRYVSVENASWSTTDSGEYFLSNSDYNEYGVGIEFDAMFRSTSSENSGMQSAIDGTPVIDMVQGKLGLHGKTLLSYSFERDTWYRVNYDATTESGKTAVYVNGELIGTINMKMVNGFYECPRPGFCFDNFTVYHVEDGNKVVDKYDSFEEGAALEFEFQTWGSTTNIGSNYIIVEYDGLVPVQGSFFDAVPTLEADGSAYRFAKVGNDDYNVNAASGNNQIYISSAKLPEYTSLSHYIIDFNLALYPATNPALVDDAGTDGDATYFEFWPGTVYKRISFSNNWVSINGDVDYNVGLGIGEFHRITLDSSYGKMNVYLDGQLIAEDVTVGAYAGLSEYPLVCFMLNNGTAVVDNMKFYNGKTFAVIDEDLLSGCGYQVTGGDKTFGIPFKSTVDVDDIDAYYWYQSANATCVANGEVTFQNWNDVEDNFTAATPMIAHRWHNYDIRNTTEIDGQEYVYMDCASCHQKTYVNLANLPEGAVANIYDGGNAFIFHDFSDNMWKLLPQSTDVGAGLVIADGVAKQEEGFDGNIHYFGAENGFKPAENNGVVINFDLTIDGTYDTNDTANYGHVIKWGIGKSAGLGVAYAGYNADTKQIFINSTENGAVNTKTADFELVEGQTYNISIELHYDSEEFADWGEDENASFKIYVDGVEVLSYGDGYDVSYDIAYDNTVSTNLYCLRDFGVAATLDNVLIASGDFTVYEEPPVLRGDFGLDGELGADDALILRQFLAKVLTADEILDAYGVDVAVVGDLNEDGVVNAKDQLMLRKIIAGLI